MPVLRKMIGCPFSLRTFSPQQRPVLIKTVSYERGTPVKRTPGVNPEVCPKVLGVGLLVPRTVQGYLAHKKTPTPLGPPLGP